MPLESVQSAESVEVMPPPPAPPPAPSPAVLRTRTDVQTKLLHHLELAFGGAPVPSHPLPKHRLYLHRIIKAHFPLSVTSGAGALTGSSFDHAIEDAITASLTLGELSDRIADLLNIPREQLF